MIYFIYWLFFSGLDDPRGKCPRDEVEMAEDDTCQGLLTIGKCAEDEEVLMDPNTRKVWRGGSYGPQHQKGGARRFL